MAPRMIAKGPIKRWINFIEMNPNLSTSNFENAKGVMYRGNYCLPWSHHTHSLNNLGIRRQQCFYWTNESESLIENREPEFALMGIQILLTTYVLRNPDETSITTSDVRDVINTVVEFTGGYQ